MSGSFIDPVLLRPSHLRCKAVKHNKKRKSSFYLSWASLSFSVFFCWQKSASLEIFASTRLRFRSSLPASCVFPYLRSPAIIDHQLFFGVFFPGALSVSVNLSGRSYLLAALPSSCSRPSNRRFPGVIAGEGTRFPFLRGHQVNFSGARA